MPTIDELWLDYNSGRVGVGTTPEPSDAADLAHRLGPLARWWMRDEWLEAAKLLPEAKILAQNWSVVDCKQLPATRGACCIIFGVEDMTRWPALRPALPLPVCWEQDPGGDGDDPKLPEAVRQLATHVRATLLEDANYEGPWRLALDTAKVGVVNLGGLHWSADSGWPIVAAALRVATRGGLLKPDIWATGVWQAGRGIGPVHHLEAKRETARALGATALLVPEGQPVALPLDAGGLKISTMRQGDLDPGRVLDDLRAVAQVPPDAGSPREDREKWHSLLPDHEAAGFYRRALLGEAAEELSEKKPEELQAVTHQVAVVSGYYDPSLSIRALKPERVLLLHTAGKMANEAKDLLTALPASVRAELAQFKESDASENIVLAASDFIGGADPKYLAFDLTGGTMEMRLSLALQAAPPGSRVFTVSAKREPERPARTLPFSERWQVWVR